MLHFSGLKRPRSKVTEKHRPAARNRELMRTSSPLALASMGMAGACWLGTGSMALASETIGSSAPFWTGDMTANTLAIGLVTGLTAAAGLGASALLSANRRARAQIEAERFELAQLKNQLNMIQTVLTTQPQVVIELARKQAPKLLFHSLQDHQDIPANSHELLNFSGWIDEGQTQLQQNMVGLLNRGRAFSMTVRTKNELLLEAEGRTSGNALLVFRDLSGSKRKEVQLLEREQSLKNRIKLMQTLFDALPMPVWFRDKEKKLSWVNGSYAKAVDAGTREDVCDKQIELLEQRQLRKVNETLENNKVFREQMQTHIGTELQSFETIAVPCNGERGSIAIDVSTQKDVQGRLDRHIASQSRTLDRVSAAIAFFDKDQHLSYSNKAYRDFWNLDENWLADGPCDGEILDRLRAMRLLPEQANYASWKSDWLEIYNSDTLLEDKWHLPDGRTVHVVVDHRPDGGVIYMFENLTESLDLQSSFNALLNVQRETLDALREGVAVFGTSGRLKLFNPAFTRIWKLRTQELSNEPHIEQLIHLCRPLYDNDDDWDAFRRSITAIDDERTSFDGHIQRLDDTILAFNSLPLPDGATLLTFVDITDEERAEQALLEKNKALEAADHLKNDFISNISYELRTPLTTIMGFGELLGTEGIGELNARQKDYLANITSSSAKLENIISNILDLVTIDAGTFELDLAPVRISEILKAARVGVRERLENAELTLDIDVKGHLDTITVDGQRVIQVLYNLLQNAIGFTEPHKTIRLIVKEEGPMVAFTVEDEGCGIPEDIRNTMFERFESRSLGSKHRGVGLGLSIVTSIVELHGGDVELLSKEGVGTKITVRFPKNGQQKLVTAAE